MHPLFLLALGTFAIIGGFLIWTRVSTERHRFNSNPEGLGGESDPLSGATNNVRDPDVLRACLDDAHRITLRELPMAKIR